MHIKLFLWKTPTSVFKNKTANLSYKSSRSATELMHSKVYPYPTECIIGSSAYKYIINYNFYFVHWKIHYITLTKPEKMLVTNAQINAGNGLQFSSCNFPVAIFQKHIFQLLCRIENETKFHYFFSRNSLTSFVQIVSKMPKPHPLLSRMDKNFRKMPNIINLTTL